MHVLIVRRSMCGIVGYTCSGNFSVFLNRFIGNITANNNLFKCNTKTCKFVKNQRSKTSPKMGPLQLHDFLSDCLDCTHHVTLQPVFRLYTTSKELSSYAALVLSCTILCSTAFCRLSNDSQRRITQRIDDVDGAAYRLHGQKLAGIAFNREWNNVGETASAAAAGNRFHSGMVRATNDPWSCAVTAPMARNLK